MCRPLLLCVLVVFGLALHYQNMKLDALTEQLHQLDGLVGTLERQTHSLDNRTVRLEDHMTTFQLLVLSLNDTVNVMNGELDRADWHLRNLTDQAKSVRQQIATMQLAISSLNVTVKQLDFNATHVNDRLVRLEQVVYIDRKNDVVGLRSPLGDVMFLGYSTMAKGARALHWMDSSSRKELSMGLEGFNVFATNADTRLNGTLHGMAGHGSFWGWNKYNATMTQ